MRNIRKIWQHINEALGRKKTLQQNMPYLTYNDSDLTEKHDIATAFNNYFCNIAKTLHEDLPDGKYHYDGPKSQNSLMLLPTSVEEINSIIRHMKMQKSSGGSDNFNSLHLKWVVDYISQPLSDLINSCMEQGVFPEVLKISKVIPIHKGGSVSDPGNYRPIALQSLFSKVFEKVIKVRIQSFH
jgi:hypothetical protein